MARRADGLAPPSSIAYRRGVGERAAFFVVTAPVAASLAGVVAILLGYGRVGVGLLLAGVLGRVVLYVIRRRDDRFAPIETRNS